MIYWDASSVGIPLNNIVRFDISDDSQGYKEAHNLDYLD